MESFRARTVPKLIIAIDGPAAAGKSSAASGLAKQLGVLYLESGSLYRGMAWKIVEEKIDPKNQSDVEAFCQAVHIEPRIDSGHTQIWVDGKEVTHDLRRPEVTRVSATISAFPGVRRRLLSLQRDIGSQNGVVMEGRDIGTVVFPDADVKFYLHASLSVRGLRRFKELDAQGVVTDLETTTREIHERDLQDSQRAIAPLKQSADAIVIDSTDLALEEVVPQMVREIERKVNGIGKSSFTRGL